VHVHRERLGERATGERAAIPAHLDEHLVTDVVVADGLQPTRRLDATGRQAAPRGSGPAWRAAASRRLRGSSAAAAAALRPVGLHLGPFGAAERLAQVLGHRAMRRRLLAAAPAAATALRPPLALVRLAVVGPGRAPRRAPACRRGPSVARRAAPPDGQLSWPVARARGASELVGAPGDLAEEAGGAPPGWPLEREADRERLGGKGSEQVTYGAACRHGRWLLRASLDRCMAIVGRRRR